MYSNGVRFGILLMIIAFFLLILFAVTSGCMGIQMPVMPQNGLKMDVPVKANPAVIAKPVYNPVPLNQSNISANATVNITDTIPTTRARFVYV